MNITINARKFRVKDAFKARAEKKLGKLDRFFGPDASAVVTVTIEKEDRQVVEITVRADNMVFRCEKAAPDMADALEAAVDALFRQIVNNKNKLVRRVRSGAFDNMEEEMLEPVDEEYNIVREKKVSLKPMTVSEAILQMNLVGHQFFLFTNADTGSTNVVYSRRSGGYGLLEPEVE